MNSVTDEVRRICARLYLGWAEKSEVPLLALDPNIYREVQGLLGAMGLELVDRPESPWYFVRLFQEHDSFAEFQKRHEYLQTRHMALLLILYAKLLLPIRAGQVAPDAKLAVTFSEIFHTYGYKFIPKRRKLAAETTVKQLIQTLVRLGYLQKPRGQAEYVAGPAMYMLHEELLTDVAEAGLETLFGLHLEGDVEEPEEAES